MEFSPGGRDRALRGLDGTRGGRVVLPFVFFSLLSPSSLVWGACTLGQRLLSRVFGVQSLPLLVRRHRFMFMLGRD